MIEDEKDDAPFDDGDDEKDDPFKFGDSDTDEVLRQEGEDVKALIRKFLRKMSGDKTEEVDNHDLLQYMRVINYNFVVLSRMLQAMNIQLVAVEETLLDLRSKVDSFVDSNDLIEESLNGTDNTGLGPV